VRTLRLAVLALVAPLPLLAATPAHAALYNPAGACATSWTILEGVLYGEVDANVLLLDEEHAATPRSGRLTCTLVIGYDGQVPLVTATGDPGLGAATVAPTTFSVPIDDGAEWALYLCSRLDLDDGRTLYHDYRGWRSEHVCDYAGPSSGTDDVWWYDLMNATACPVLGAVPVAGKDLQTFWEDCETIEQSGAIVISRGPAGPLAASLPSGWTCTDVHTGLVVAPGAPLAAPDPGVSCGRNVVASDECSTLWAGGHQSGAGPLTVTNGCGTTAMIRSVYADGPGYPRPAPDTGYGAWRCTVDEPAVAPSYDVFCAVNV
jgi:hypothetical protein